METAKINYMRSASWTHCLWCHKNVHHGDTILHFTKTCPNKKDEVAKYPCRCKMPDFDFVPEREGLVWEEPKLSPPGAGQNADGSL